MASRTPGKFRNYRWKELGLLIIPFIILLMGMTQLLLIHDNPTTFSVKGLPTLQELIPILGLIGMLVAANIVFSFFFPKADQIILPLVGLLSGIGVLMALRVGP